MQAPRDGDDYAGWNDEPGCPHDDETMRDQQPKKEEDEEMEQRPRALTGPIGDDFFEQPACFSPPAHNMAVVSP